MIKTYHALLVICMLAYALAVPIAKQDDHFCTGIIILIKVKNLLNKFQSIIINKRKWSIQI